MQLSHESTKFVAFLWPSSACTQAPPALHVGCGGCPLAVTMQHFSLAVPASAPTPRYLLLQGREDCNSRRDARARPG